MEAAIGDEEGAKRRRKKKGPGKRKKKEEGRCARGISEDNYMEKGRQ
jgi:hypothetical protein